MSIFYHLIDWVLDAVGYVEPPQVAEIPDDIEEDDVYEPFIPENRKITSMKISEFQLVKLLDIAKAASAYAYEQETDIGGFTSGDIDAILGEVGGNLSTELVDVSPSAVVVLPPTGAQ